MSSEHGTKQLLAAILVELMASRSQAQKIAALRRGGLSNQEIADTLGTTSGVVAQQLYVLGKTTKKTKKTKKTPAKKGKKT